MAMAGRENGYGLKIEVVRAQNIDLYLGKNLHITGLNLPYVTLKMGPFSRRTTANDFNKCEWSESFPLPGVYPNDVLEIALRHTASSGTRDPVGIGYVKGSTLINRRNTMFWVVVRDVQKQKTARVLIGITELPANPRPRILSRRAPQAPAIGYGYGGGYYPGFPYGGLPYYGGYGGYYDGGYLGSSYLGAAPSYSLGYPTIAPAAPLLLAPPGSPGVFL